MLIMKKKSLKAKFFLFGTIAIVTAKTIGLASSSLTNIWPSQTAFQPKNLYVTLDYYGFKKPEQKEALRYLMKISGIKNTDELLTRKINNSHELVDNLLSLVSATQDKFTIFSGKQERWDVRTSDWMKDNKNQFKVIEALKRLKMLDNVPPEFNTTKAICILGASTNAIITRFEYLEYLINLNILSSDWLILIAGERYATPDRNGDLIDGKFKDLTLLAKNLGKDVSQLTETDLIFNLYKNSKIYNKVATQIIDTPKKKLPRPTTETTVIELTKWLKKHPEVNRISFISNQPYVKYQQAIIAQVFEQEKIYIEFEVIGPEYKAPILNNQAADKIKYIVGALGGHIWASTPGIIDKLAVDIEPRLVEHLLSIYAKQPLIYNNLENKYKKKS
jgi:Holliday junction resolvasome RuvABC DNA-binding subunit